MRELARRDGAGSFGKVRLMIKQGEVGDRIFIVFAGLVRAFSRCLTNVREITHGVDAPGECVGEPGLDGGPRGASVEVVAACSCGRIERPTAARVCLRAAG